jgi:hypothetical protein
MGRDGSGGSETTIVLGNLDRDEDLSQILFSIPIEINRRSGEYRTSSSVRR